MIDSTTSRSYSTNGSDPTYMPVCSSIPVGPPLNGGWDRIRAGLVATTCRVEVIVASRSITSYQPNRSRNRFRRKPRGVGPFKSSHCPRSAM